MSPSERLIIHKATDLLLRQNNPPNPPLHVMYYYVIYPESTAAADYNGDDVSE